MDEDKNGTADMQSWRNFAAAKLQGRPAHEVERELAQLSAMQCRLLADAVGLRAFDYTGVALRKSLSEKFAITTEQHVNAQKDGMTYADALRYMESMANEVERICNSGAPPAVVVAEVKALYGDCTKLLQAMRALSFKAASELPTSWTINGASNVEAYTSVCVGQVLDYAKAAEVPVTPEFALGVLQYAADGAKHAREQRKRKSADN